MPDKKSKYTSVPIPGKQIEKLSVITAVRKEEGNLAWSQKNIIIELIDKEFKRMNK